MKICFLQHDFPPESFGGAGRVAYRLAKEFFKAGHQVFVIATVQDKTKEREEDNEGIKVFHLYSYYPEKWRAWLSLCNPKIDKKVETVLKKIRPDVTWAHIVHFYLSYHCLKIAKKYSKKVFLTAHDVMLFHYGKLIPDYKTGEINYKVNFYRQIKEFRWRYNPLRNLAIKYYLKYADKIFSVSDALKNVLEINGFKNIETVYNGIDADDFEANESEVDNFRNKFDLIGKKVVFFNGRLSRAKGGEQLIKSIQMVKKEIDNVLLLISGNQSNYTNSLLKLAEESGLKQNLIFTGWLNEREIKFAYHASDLCVVPSICFDSFPTVNLEAMAAKKPVIATCFGGSREIVRDGETGYIVNPFDVKTMAGKIIDLLKNPKKAEKFGQAGYQRVKENFSLAKQAKGTLKYI